MFLKNKSFVSIVLCCLITNISFANQDELFVEQQLNKKQKQQSTIINDSILYEGQNELALINNDSNEEDFFNNINQNYLEDKIEVSNRKSNFSLIPLEPTAVNESEVFSLRHLMNEHLDWNFAIDPTIALDKEYRWSTFNSTEWVSVLRDIGAYEDFIVEVSEANKTLKMIKKVKSSFNVSHFEEKDINYFLKKLKDDFEKTEIYRYKDMIYIEGNKFEVEKALKELEKFNDSVKKSISKFIVNVYETEKNNQSGLAAMIDKDTIKPTKKIVLQNPKIKKPYKINLGTDELIIKINSKGIELNGVVINNNDLKFYGYKINKWFIEVKSSDI